MIRSMDSRESLVAERKVPKDGHKASYHEEHLRDSKPGSPKCVGDGKDAAAVTANQHSAS